MLERAVALRPQDGLYTLVLLGEDPAGAPPSLRVVGAIREVLCARDECDAVLARLAATRGCALARMSGSGATCFGLYADEAAARSAADAIAAEQPGWWLAAAPILA